MTRIIRIATQGVAQDYRASLVPCVLKSLGYEINWCEAAGADLLIRGPFFSTAQKNQRWIPKPLRPAMTALLATKQRPRRPLILFQTAENHAS